MFLVSMWPNRHVTKLLKEFHKNRKIIFDKYNAQEICERVLERDSNALKFALDKYKSKEMYQKLITRELHALNSFPDDSKTKSLCEKYV